MNQTTRHTQNAIDLKPLRGKHHLAVYDTCWAQSHVALWRVVGEASHDSGGGVVTLYVLTSADALVPDLMAALEQARPKETWYLVHSITRMDFSFPRAEELYASSDIRRPTS